MTEAGLLLAADTPTLFSTTALASPLPSETYRPTGSHTIKADHQGNGEFGYEAKLSGRYGSILSLTKKMIARTCNKGSHMVEPEIKHDDADLKFKYGKQELGISIEDKDQGRIEYKADLDLNKD